jgi:hypothetical protein
MRKIYSLFGIIAPLSYTLAVIVGGFMLNGYSHLYNSISELTASNVQKIPIIFLLLAIYNFSMILFGAGLFSSIKLTKGKIASVLIIVIGLLGLGMLIFAQDPRNEPMTVNGTIHLALAALSSLFTMISIILLGICFPKKIAWYSIVSFAVVLISGGTAAISVGKDLALGGLFERITIGAFMQWVFVISLFMQKNRPTDIFFKKSPSL